MFFAIEVLRLGNISIFAEREHEHPESCHSSERNLYLIAVEADRAVCRKFGFETIGHFPAL